MEPSGATDGASATDLPAWDLSSLLDEPYASAHERLAADIGRLEATYDRLGVRGGDPRAATAEDIAAIEQILPMVDDVLAQARLLNGVLHGRVTTDTTDDLAATRQSQVAVDLARLATLTARFEAWIAAIGHDALVAGSDRAAEHEWPLRKAERSGRHRMSDPEEALAAELRLTGAAAWARLHRDVTGRLEATVDVPGRAPRTLPMAAVRGLASDPDPAVRRAAWEGEQPAWASVSIPLAAALNGAKGEQAVLDRRRGWSDPLDVALHHNSVDRRTLEALTDAVERSLPDFGRYLRAKATLLGHDGTLPWWDLLAPLPDPPPADDPSGSTTTTGDGPSWDWQGATETVRDAFARYAPGMADLLARALDERWIDAAPRAGKVGGAYCMALRGGESRVLMNFTGGPDATRTLAHELGHAYHNLQMSERTWLQRQTPMALAETASIFCETLTVSALLERAPAAHRLAIADLDLQGTTQIVVDIHSRFLFETELCRRRASGTLSVEELCETMLDAQAQAYGDAIDPATRHRWMWAVKSHYFTPFYNWPYTFGLLFGIGLVSRFRADPERFRRGYDDLLSSTGLADAATLAGRFDIDLGDPAFWDSSLDVVRERIAEVAEAAKLVGS